MILRGPLNYEIGLSGPFSGADGRVTEVSYDCNVPAAHGQSIAYCNLFNEKYSQQNDKERAVLGPYLKDSDTAQEYGEGEIDPHGQGWARNIDAQISRRKGGGFQCCEWDNPDAYGSHVAISVLERTWGAGLYAIAKNPLLVEGDHAAYVAHPSIIGCIVEEGAGTCDQMQLLRRIAGKPILPVWFVAFKSKRWADDRAATIRYRRYVNMGVTWSPGGEYVLVEDILKPTVVQ